KVAKSHLEPLKPCCKLRCNTLKPYVTYAKLNRSIMRQLRNWSSRKLKRPDLKIEPFYLVHGGEIVKDIHLFVGHTNNVYALTSDQIKNYMLSLREAVKALLNIGTVFSKQRIFR